jgi:hypothetical protein
VDLSNHAEAKARKIPELDLDELVKSVLDEGQRELFQSSGHRRFCRASNQRSVSKRKRARV